MTPTPPAAKRPSPAPGAGDPATTIPPSLLYSILCDDVRREANGKLILIGLFETIGAAEFPATHPALYVVNGWGGGVGAFTQHTRILGLDSGLLIQDRDTTFTLSDLRAKHSVIARFNNLPLAQSGEYAVEIRLNGDLKLRYPLIVEKQG